MALIAWVDREFKILASFDELLVMNAWQACWAKDIHCWFAHSGILSEPLSQDWCRDGDQDGDEEEMDIDGALTNRIMWTRKYNHECKRLSPIK